MKASYKQVFHNLELSCGLASKGHGIWFDRGCKGTYIPNRQSIGYLHVKVSYKHVFHNLELSRGLESKSGVRHTV